MLIHEVCKECSLTKKAIEYYIGQELLFPTVRENGYRSFSEEDMLRLKKISILRNLGLSVPEIRDVLSSEPDAAALNDIYHRRTLQMAVLQEKQKLIRELAKKRDWEYVQGRLEQLQKKQTILERFINAFPGYYGKFLWLHFAPYLNAPILTDAQQEAFDTIIAFLDSVDLPADLKKCLDENEEAIKFDADSAEKISASMNAAIYETEKFIADHKKSIESCIAFRQSEEYKATSVYHLEKALRQFNSVSGYNDIFIPAMRQLSESYRTYQDGLLRAGEKLLSEIPSVKILF